ncbi:secreted RxLR effector protein 161-like [Nicotiana sylvestris]|uniref:secreted RxLR effector protein 161-like n=1 Tax=Nicotiana sylvestris TaxID=4096 RepID=UPI00388CDAA7
MTKSPFTGREKRAPELLGLIHIDVCGPMKIQARGGYSYFITFTDDMSRYGFVYLMKHKRFCSEVEKQTGKSIKLPRKLPSLTVEVQELNEVQEQANPGEEYWKVVKTILKHLRRTKDQFLIYGDSKLKLEGYTDASFSSDRDDSKSISGYVFTLNGGAVSWKSSKQATVSDSVAEAEYKMARTRATGRGGRPPVPH